MLCVGRAQLATFDTEIQEFVAGDKMPRTTRLSHINRETVGKKNKALGQKFQRDEDKKFPDGESRVVGQGSGQIVRPLPNQARMVKISLPGQF